MDNNRVLKFELHVKKIHLLFNFQIKPTAYFSLCLSICVCLSVLQFSTQHFLSLGMFMFVYLSFNSQITTIYISIGLFVSVFLFSFSFAFSLQVSLSICLSLFVCLSVSISSFVSVSRSICFSLSPTICFWPSVCICPFSLS